MFVNEPSSLFFVFFVGGHGFSADGHQFLHLIDSVETFRDLGYLFGRVLQSWDECFNCAKQMYSMSACMWWETFRYGEVRRQLNLSGYEIPYCSMGRCPESAYFKGRQPYV